MHDFDENADTTSDPRGFQQLMLSHEPDLLEILNCVLNITNSQIRTYLALLRNQNADIDTLADELGRSGNTVREHLAVLQENQLVIRDARIMEDGRYYTYEAVTPDEAKPTLHKVVKHWIAHVSDRIDSLKENPTGDPIQYRSGAATVSDNTTDLDNFTAGSATRKILHDETPSLRSISTCVFGLSGPLLKLYLALLKHPRSTAQELAEVQDYARSTVAGRLNDLQDWGLARPAGREIETGNRMAYEYIPRPLDEVKTAMKTQLHKEWNEHTHDCIEEFDLSSVDYR
jgi:predicted transcriptional regulator